MDKLALYQLDNDKEEILLELNISGKTRQWILPGNKQKGWTRKRMAFEISDETYFNNDELELLEAGDLNIRNFKKKKIEFSAEGPGSFRGNYIFLHS